MRKKFLHKPILPPPHPPIKSQMVHLLLRIATPLEDNRWKNTSNIWWQWHNSTPGGWGVAPTLSLGALVPQSILCPYPFSDYSGKTYSPFWTNRHESHVPKHCTYLSGHLRAVHPLPPWGYHKTRFLTRLTFVNILLNPRDMTCTQQHHWMENITEI